MRDVNDSVVNIKLRDKVRLFIFSAKTTLENTSHRERRAGERVIVDLTFQVPLKHSRYGVAVAVSHLERKGRHKAVKVDEELRPHEVSGSQVAGCLYSPSCREGWGSRKLSCRQTDIRGSLVLLGIGYRAPGTQS